MIELNRAVAVSFRDGPTVALQVVEALSKELADYQYLHATRADLLRRLGRLEESATAYRRAADLAGNEAERRYLLRRRSDLG